MWLVWVVYVTLVLIVFKASVVVKLIEFKRRVLFALQFPGPPFFEVLKNKKRVLAWLVELRQQYGSLFRIWFGLDLFVFVTDPDDLKIVLTSNQLLYKSKNYRMLEPWLGKGLLTNGGESWFHRRRMLTPAFHFKILNTFKEPMEECCKIFIDKLETLADGNAFDIYPYITLFTLDVICETSMGIKKHAQEQSNSEYVKAVKDICRLMHIQSFSLWRRIGLLYKFSNDGVQRSKAIRILHTETKRVIELRRAMLNDLKINSSDLEADNDIGVKRRLAFLDMLLLAQKEGAKITDKQIREEVDTFMFEGHDTTSSALAFATYLLSQHKDVQDKVLQEINEVEGTNLDNLHYLEAVIKETLRLYPSVPFYSRIVQEELKLTTTSIPKGTAVSVLSYAVHRDPRHYPNPEKFNPERFIDNENSHPFSFVAFSAGPRNCIGQKFAMIELKTTLINLIKKFEILPVDGFKPQPLAELVTKSGNGIRIKLRKR